MLELSNYVKKQALLHAKDKFPRESCGLLQVVGGRQKYFKCNNIAIGIGRARCMRHILNCAAASIK